MSLTEKHSENFYKLTDEEKKILLSGIEILEETFSLGINFLNKFIISHGGTFKNCSIGEFVVTSLLREVMDRFDGIIILMKNSSVSNSHILYRSILEAYFDLNFILNNVQERSAIYYYHKEKDRFKKNKIWRDKHEVKNSNFIIEDREEYLKNFKNEHLLGVELGDKWKVSYPDNFFYAMYQYYSMDTHNQNFSTNSFSEDINSVQPFRRFKDVITTVSLNVTLVIIIITEINEAFKFNLIEKEILDKLTNKRCEFEKKYK